MKEGKKIELRQKIAESMKSDTPEFDIFVLMESEYWRMKSDEKQNKVIAAVISYLIGAAVALWAVWLSSPNP